MSKHAASSDDERAPKHIRCEEEDSWVTSSPLVDEGAWRILEQFLTTDMTFPEMEDAFSSYLGDQYSADDWKDARDVLFSGDGDDSVALANLHVLKARHILHMSSDSSDIPHPATDSPLKHPYLDLKAGEDSQDEDDEAQGEDGPSVLSPKVTRLPGQSGQHKFAAAMSLIFDRYEGDWPRSSGHHHHRTAQSSDASMSRMYLVHVHRIAMKYIAGHLQSNGFAVTVSPWAQGKLYVVSDSPKTITASLSQSDLLHVKEYLLISEEDCEVLKCSSIKLPNLSWVRIKNGKYKGDIGYVFDSDQSNLFVTVLIPPCDFPYPTPWGSVALLNRSLLPNGKPVSNIIRDEEVVGFSYNGEQYFMGLQLKKFHCYLLDLIAFPSADDILLYQEPLQ
ncbi:hypothetical protein DFH29DRAFT_1002676 [Suillus ampliporus]|nr:hypothetical protein DFH29DRAFT_1002676 [Suillus ampliporus]